MLRAATLLVLSLLLFLLTSWLTAPTAGTPTCQLTQAFSGMRFDPCASLDISNVAYAGGVDTATGRV